MKHNAIDISLDRKIRRTRQAFFWTHLLRAPFWAVYHLLLFILYKDLHASAFQIALFIALKPVVSIFSIYWGHWIHNRPDRLVQNIVWGGVVSYAPFLLLPLFYNAWYVIFASALFMTLYRGVIPAWMEVFKRNLPAEHKHITFSYTTIVSFTLCSLLSLLIGPLLDDQAELWRWILTATALLGSLAYFFQRNIPVSSRPEVINLSWSFSGHLLDPWKKAFSVLKTHSNFRFYVIGFMVLGGSGLMVLQPALPLYFVDVLGLSYTELAVALNTCKGLGLVMTSLLWAKAMPRTHISRFAALILFLAALFPLVLLSAQFSHIWIYVAYLGYGIMQAGSELTWHLSGLHFSGNVDSSRFTNVNILVVGLRGFLLPQLGALLCLAFAPVLVLLFATLCCFLGTCFMLLCAKKTDSVPIVPPLYSHSD